MENFAGKVNLKRTVSPCYDCKDRHSGCHAECEKYKSWKVEDLEKKSQRNAEKSRYLEGTKEVLLTTWQKNHIVRRGMEKNKQR